MTTRVVYIERSERGSRLTGVRLVTPRGDERWSAVSVGSAESGGDESIDDAARWIASRVSPAPQLDLVVLDADGSVCLWSTVPGSDPALVEAVVRQHAESGSEAGGDGSDSSSSSGRLSVIGYYAPGAADSTIQPLGWTTFAPQTALDGRRRSAILAVGDGVPRLLIDRIDSQGVGCGMVVTIWHAMARAWDPSVPRLRGTDHDDPVVLQSPAGPAAIILIEPAGRVLWAWSLEGRLVAGGAMRMPARRHSPDAPPDTPLLTADAAARLASDWLAWSAQVALAPERIIVLAPSSAQEASEGSIGAARFGQGISAAWPTATVDLAVHDDPVGATLMRVAERLDDRDGIIPVEEAMDPSRSLVSLSTRPGGSHRTLILWSSLAITAAAAGVGVFAYGLRVQASNLSLLARQVEGSWKQDFSQVTLAKPPMPGLEVMELRTEVERARRETAPLVGIEQARPILKELETLSHVLALPDFELTNISLDSLRSSVTIQLNAPDLASAEALNEALGRIAGSDISTWTFVPGTRTPGSDKVPCTYSGVFAAATLSGPGPGGSP